MGILGDTLYRTIRVDELCQGDIIITYGEGRFSKLIRLCSYFYRKATLRRVFNVPSHAEVIVESYVTSHPECIGAVGGGVRRVGIEYLQNYKGDVEVWRPHVEVRDDESKEFLNLPQDRTGIQFSPFRASDFAVKSLGREYSNRQNLRFFWIGFVNILWFWLVYVWLRLLTAWTSLEIPRLILKPWRVNAKDTVCSVFAGTALQVGYGVKPENARVLTPAALRDCGLVYKVGFFKRLKG